MDPIARRTSRRHAQRLSTDSSVTQSSTAYTALPAYSSRHSASASIYSDKPPEYQGQSADEADLDDSDHELQYNARLPTSPFRKRSANPSRRSSYNRPSPSSSAAPPDPLDSLLARSVHALELSNVLLQSTMATRSNLATSMAHDHRVDRNLELSATFLNNRIRDTSVAQTAWLNDIDGVVRDVHHLYDDGSSVSRSLPSGGSGSGSPPPILSLGARVLPESSSQRRRSSYGQDSDRPRLLLSHSPPSNSRHYMSRPPRAMTQYVSVASEHGDAGESTADSESIYMPSTIGLQSTPHVSSFRSVNGSRRPDPLRLHHPNSSSPGFIQYGGVSPGIEHGGAWGGSGPRRSRLSSPRSAGPSRASITSSSPSQRSVRSSSDSQRPSARDRRYGRAGLGISTAHHARSRSASDSSARGRSRTRSQTPTTHSRADSINTILHKPLMPPLRSMTPPLEESPPEEQLSSDSGPNVTRTLDALRRILDAAPPPEKPKVIPKRPSFLMPKSPTPSPEVGTSTATATVSRLFTKGTHSTRDTPPLRPSLRLPNGSPRESMSISAPSSGRSTPRQVAFAQLPEPYSAEGTRRGFDKSRSSKSKSKSGGEKDKDEPQGFWSMLFSAVTPPSGSHNPNGRMEDRVEDRMSRNWARSGGQSTMDDYLY